MYLFSRGGPALEADSGYWPLLGPSPGPGRAFNGCVKGVCEARRGVGLCATVQPCDVIMQTPTLEMTLVYLKDHLFIGLSVKFLAVFTCW